ncbi:MAG: DUF736 domain-containing protein [Proteobacteria bacterium]|nr:DUF736 domain-containing protein [Pseudomonadota bacterium]
MATIGTFTTKDGKIVGKVRTLTLDAPLAFLPNENREAADAPAYRIFCGKTEVGAAWAKTSDRTGRDYFSVRLDDPSLPAPIYASLIAQDDGSHALIWSRRD